MGSQLPTLLRIVRGEEADPDEAARESGPEPQPEPHAPAAAQEPARPPRLALAAPPTGHAHHMLSSAQDFIAGLRRQVRSRRDAPGGLGAFLDHGHAPTNAEQREYARLRAWVTPGDEGGWVEQVGIAYYATLGKVIPALCNAIGWTFARQLRAAIAGAIAYVLALAVVFTFVGTAAGFVMIAVLAALLGAGRGLAEVAAEAKRRASARHEPSQDAPDGTTEEGAQWDH